MSILLISYVIAGFWPKYFGVIVDPALRPPHPGWIIHAHVAVFLGWMLIFVMQALLAWADRSSSQARPLDGRLRECSLALGTFHSPHRRWRTAR
jgi:hypothetical protein